MPDWCDNLLDVWHDGDGEQELATFARAASSEDISLTLSALRPDPAHLVTDREIVAWRHLNWGVKWDVDEVDVERVATGLRYRFVSAWSGPTYWCEYASALYPSLHFRLSYISIDGMVATSLRFDQGVAVAADEALGADVGDDAAQWAARAHDLLTRASAPLLADIIRASADDSAK